MAPFATPPATAAAAPPTTFRKGDKVEVFYRMARKCLPHRRYLAVLDPKQGSYRPRTGLSDGWVPAVVAEDYQDPRGEAEVAVEYDWRHFYTVRGQLTEQDSTYVEGYPLACVRASATSVSGGQTLRPLISLQAPPPELAIISFRWGGINEICVPEQWGRTGNSVSDVFINSFLDSAVVPTLGTNFEVWTVYIEDKSDMMRLADAAHLIFGPQHPARRAHHTCAMYHLYPTAFEENCVPNAETGEDCGAALVDQQSFFRMMKAVERAGVQTKFPHPSGFYELLASKRWTSMMSLVPHLRVPPTVAVPRMLIEQSCAVAAERSFDALCDTRHRQALLRREAPPQGRIEKGVAKLGFSWEALDVKFWSGQRGLESALSELTQVIEINQELTGQPHDLESVIVQEYVEHDLEMRLYVVEGGVETIVYTKFCEVKGNLEFGGFKELFTHEDAAKQWMGGDTVALADGERQCREVTSCWLAWVKTQLCEIPSAIRFDYFVGRGPDPGKATIWTLEICELGFSMLGANTLPDKVFAAMLRSCLGKVPAERDINCPTDCSGDVPQDPSSSVACDEVAREPAKAGTTLSTAAKQETNSNDADESVPPQLYIHVPKTNSVTPDQLICTGMYRLEPERANGHPLWRHSRGDRWLYHGSDNYWYVGDDDEHALDFDCDQGYIRHADSLATLPHDLSGEWEMGPEWYRDKNIAVVVNPDDLDKGRGKGKGKFKGKKMVH